VKAEEGVAAFELLHVDALDIEETLMLELTELERANGCWWIS
jgi:hypothetical protein